MRRAADEPPSRSFSARFSSDTWRTLASDVETTRRGSRPKLRTAFLAALCLVVARPELPRHPADPLLLSDAATLAALEDQGLSFAEVVGAERLEVIARSVRHDMAELTRDAPTSSPRRPFMPAWLERGRFELVGVVNRIDRRAFDDAGCGEVRLVYRLSLKNRRRPRTRLPMTLNVRYPQPRPKGDADCRRVAARWTAKSDVIALLSDLPAYTKIEINYQSIHVPATRKDMDDSAEYILRAFKVDGHTLVEDGLFNTPRADLDALERARLLAWVESHVREIDDGTAVVPEELLAKRVVSVSPRGLARAENRVFSRVLGDASEQLARLPLGERALVQTPDLLLRRLDELTCVGCHQSRGIAGFHLLGEERDATSTFNSLAVGHSPHLAADLGWRRADLASAERGNRPPRRPFAGFPDGRAGADCGLTPGFASFTCAPGLVCRDSHHAPLGVCAPASSALPGDPCEDVTLAPSARPEGPTVAATAPDATCPAPSGDMLSGNFCAPNWLGFTGGMCSERCARAGEVHGRAICAPLPAAGYEADCFTSREPVEKCLERHLATALVASCDATTPCRDDYGCARVPGAPPGTGACVPPYFLFQARVDGPLLDR
jgi:hypothetical protein